MRIIVFGGSGFLGSHVADHLSEIGHEVTIFDLKPSPYLRSDQKMIVGDILNRSLIDKAIRGKEIVYHFAGLADIHEAQVNPVETIEYNVLGTIYILEACHQNGIKRFIYASTIYVYSDHGSFYRSSKQSCELFIENYRKIYNLDFTILRFGSLYGERANHFNFIYTILRQALLDGKIQRKGTGSEIRDYIHVRDAAKLSADILLPAYANSYIMITGEQTIRVRDLLAMIREIFHYEIEVEYLDEKLEEHYEITPYSFKPTVAKKIVPDYYHDLGQGILGCIYSVYEELIGEGYVKDLEVSKFKSKHED